MNGSEEPVEIEVEPEIQNILPFEDFYIDQFVDYLESDNVNGNGHVHSDASSQLGNHHKHQSNNNNHKPCNYQCTVCRETLASGTELLKHVRTHTKLLGSHRSFYDSKKQTKCCMCMRTFDHPTLLRVHEETQHTPPFRCRYCNSYHTTLKYYKSHLKLHQMQQQRRLSSSSRVPEQSSMLLHHQNNNHYKQSKKSGFKHFYTPPKLTTAAVASLAVQTNLSNQGLPSSSLSPLRCKYCSKLFAKFTTLRKHEMLHKLNGNYHHQSFSNNFKFTPEVDVEIKNEYPASISASSVSGHSKSTPSALTLTPSLLSNLNKLANLKSSECNDGKKPAILININTNDTPQVESAKKSQEMPLNSSSGLMISSVSSVDKNYFETIEKQKDPAAGATVFIQNGKKAVSLADLQCPICKKIVSQPFSLKVHLRTHTLEKPYSCPICTKSFSQSCNLKTHMNIHNKQQYYQQQQQNHQSSSPLMCNICNKTFLKASSLNTHMISHTAKLYCYACNINFDDDAVTYSQHMQVTHNVIMTKDLISRAKANLQRSESMNKQRQASTEEEDTNGNEISTELTEQPRLMEVFQVQSSSVTNGQIPKLKITIKKEPMVPNEQQEEGNESDSSSSSSSSSNSSSSSSSSGSSSSSTSNNNSNDEKNDNNNR